MTLASWSAHVIVSPLVVAATAIICWKVVRGKQWYTPLADHSHQYLIRTGWRHRDVLPARIALMGLPVAPASGMVLWKLQVVKGVAAVVTVVLVGAWYLVHFVVAKERVTA